MRGLDPPCLRFPSKSLEWFLMRATRLSFKLASQEMSSLVATSKGSRRVGRLLWMRLVHW